ncbi:NAD(P)H-dependent glycerol-3-phosphate dehydrogenase [Pseudochelatococcus contaminans]|uniref:Glycerol-3-phosphate dehydrogenase [NAD(P)+] n=1 Tax=Pseudochelatococcus contaminans TaxID=1538103 RepID=A0A7W5Z2C4_9HYPH|nr:NAD(P)H-dependent glycerol-3-phosphate dehydrogenase [Pseudochelatococcus contaminans]MBB3808823.1 glycerol-3-phosphate dehydrogenase (NAD(P)+) [Pseudochelatococcus contaminans]
MTDLDRPIAVLGAGSWGTALANAIGQKDRAAVLIDRDAERARTMAQTRENTRYLPGVMLSPHVEVTADQSALSSAAAILLAVPAQQMRGALRAVAALVPPGTPLIVCAKGIERDTGLFMTDVVTETVPHAIPAILSGPSFADDVARGLPTAVSLASADLTLAAALAQDLSSPSLRVYHGDDVRGVEIGGAAKNVLAIACGVVYGRKLGESARAALVARGFAEITRFARALDARAETLMGLSGLGDTVLSCGSNQSRNFAFGEALGLGVPVAQASGGKLAEGAFTASALLARGRKAGVEMPVCEAVEALVAERVTVDQAIEALMTRPLKPEA